MKVVGKRTTKAMGPRDCHHRAQQMIEQMDRLNPYPRPRGFVFKAKTWDEYRAWRSKQDNPRLW